MERHTRVRASKDNRMWQIQEAKAQFSQLVEDANRKGYQVITKQGVPVAVILSKQEFDNLAQPKTSLLSFFKEAPCQEIELDIQRSKDSPIELSLRPTPSLGYRTIS